MSVDRQRRVVDRIVDEAYNRGEFAVLDECIAPDYSSEMLPEDIPGGPEAFKQVIAGFRTAFPDLHFAIDDQIAEPGKIVNRWTMTGTHRGSFMGVDPTNRPVEVHGISLWYLRGNQVVDFWVVMDNLRLKEQLQAAD